MLFLDGVYIEGANGTAARFRWVRAPTSEELTQLAQRIGRFLEKEGLLERDANDCMDGRATQEAKAEKTRGSSRRYSPTWRKKRPQWERACCRRSEHRRKLAYSIDPKTDHLTQLLLPKRRR